ncbi:hypothetical protein ABZ215_36600, partial [Amycolatopsis sp. NPDC006131]|uniref:hypothetical protein n=1 Tax=Amycolatopsis sp. NPDC006131 TaxID=3156731 RepID=UPI0033A4407A
RNPGRQPAAEHANLAALAQGDMPKPEGDGMTTQPPTQGETTTVPHHPGACPSGEDIPCFSKPGRATRAENCRTPSAQ